MKIIKFIKRIFLSTPKQEKKEQTEEEYYEELFTKNAKWSQVEPNYDENLRWEIIKKYIEQDILCNNQNNVNILDLGCGRGWLTNLLSAYGTTTGIEPVKPVVEHARNLFPTINFIAGTSKNIVTTNKNNYNLIVSSEVIEHVPDSEKEDFINDIAELLDENGYLIITTPRKEAQKQWNKLSGSNQPIEDWISENDLEKLITKNYFKTCKLNRIAFPPIPNAPEIEIYQVWLFQKR